ncbi:MAG: M20 family metallopeptidase [bacterium]|nr:M20 family metallopeptidase [bacterium]
MIETRKILAALKGREEEIIATLREAVSVDSPTFPGTGTSKVAGIFEEKYRSIGAETERLPGTHGTGDHLLARFRGNNKDSGRIFIIGHCDTVFPEGEAARRPFTLEGDRARGPGVADMKGGLVNCFFALSALMAAGFREFGEILVLYDTDEELGNPSSRALIEKWGKDAKASLIIEPGRADGSIVAARKGSLYGEVNIHGVAAHAGVDMDKGRSAVHELAHKILDVYALTREGGTVNVTGLSGGERPHIVAASAGCFVEIRADRQQTLDGMAAELRELIAKPAIDGTSLELTIKGGRPAMERNEKTDWLIGLAKPVAEEAGFELTFTPTGGGSDGNYLSPLGVPVLDGLGPVGGGLHTAEEYLEIPSLVPRAALLAGLIARLGAAG